MRSSREDLVALFKYDLEVFAQLERNSRSPPTIAAPSTPEDEPLEATLEEQKFLRQLRSNPLMGDQLEAIADKFEEIDNGMDAHQAEAALIVSLKDLGKGLVQLWAQNTQLDVISQSPGLRKHAKKTPVACNLRHDKHRNAGHLRQPQGTVNPSSNTLQRILAISKGYRGFQIPSGTTFHQFCGIVILWRPPGSGAIFNFASISLSSCSGRVAWRMCRVFPSHLVA